MKTTGNSLWLALPVAAVALAFEVAAAPLPPAPSIHPPASPPPGNASRGAEIYEAKCGACHSLDANRIGPRHRGVFGRKAGGVPGFAYTPALKNSGIVWNAQTLDKWLQGPVKMVPGTAMGFQLRDAQERADVIAYLKQQSGK
ncbi:MAG TPA: cytochrome c family protein [Rhizomicrobium sp.]|nr:cytochrome c family protein [Rhizomicrobium sp.]